MGGPVAIERDGALGGRLRAIFEGGSVAGLGDGPLLDRVAAGGDAARAAMTALVERHGSMVLRACRAGARDPNDADDAFQAVFLVLARRAGSLRTGDSIGPWLHGVARRTTTAARVASARRKALDRRHAEAMRRSVDPTPPDDLAALIHEELGKLPDRYRTPLVLCDLEGLSHEDAARQLGWPVGTVKSRQARGRERLRGRLVRRGVAPSASVAIAAGSARAAVPPGLAGSTIEASLRFTTGGSAGAVPAAPALLARKVLTAMTLSRLTLPALALLTAGAVALGVSSFSRGGPPAPDGPPAGVNKPSTPPPPAGSLLQFHFVADASRDSGAIAKALASDLDKPPEGYRWFLLGTAFAGNDRGGLAIRKDGAGEWVLLKLDPQEVTERDLARVSNVRDRNGPALSFRFTPDGGRRFGELTGSRLPEDEGTIRHRLAIVVEREVVSAPMVFSVIRDAAIIEFGNPPTPDAVDRLYGLLARAAEGNARPTAGAASTQAEAIRLAREVDLPALAGADRVTIERDGADGSITSAVPSTVASYRDALTIEDVPPSGGKRAASLTFSRGDVPVREVWVYESGEWGFVRPGTSWTVGRSEALRELIRLRPAK